MSRSTKRSTRPQRRKLKYPVTDRALYIFLYGNQVLFGQNTETEGDNR